MGAEEPTVAAADGRCPRCGGGHTARQRCPLDAPAQLVEPEPAPLAASALSAGPVVLATPGQQSPPQRMVYIPLPRYRPRIEHPLPSPLPAEKRGRPVVSFLRWSGSIIGTLTLTVCLIVAGVFIALLPALDQDPSEALLVIVIATVVGLVFGVLLLWVSSRVWAKVVYAVTATVLLTGGLAMIVAAPVVRQMNTPGLAEYRGYAALTWFGLLTTALGIALGALCVRWSLRREARRRLVRWSRLLGSAYGVWQGLSGLFLVFALLFLINGEASIDNEGNISSVVEQAIGFATLAMWAFVPGALLAYHGISSSMGEGSSRYKPPVFLYFAVAFAVLLGLGHLNMRQESPMAWPMPVLHVVTAAMPSLGLVALAARGHILRGSPVSGLSWRQVSLAMAISMTVGVNLALYVESIGSLYAVVLLLVHNGAFEFAQNSDAVFDAIGEADFILTDNEQFFAGLVTAAVLAPLIEEFGKSLGARFMMQPTTTRAQMFVLGAFAGAAFGFLEDLLYGLAVVSENLGDWWLIMLLRGGSTSLHVLCTGLCGVGWWYWSRRREHRTALKLFGTAIFIHAAWNGAFTAIDSRILGLETLDDRTIEIVAYAVVTVVSLAMIAAIPLIARRLREPPPPSVEGTPLGAMQAWLG